MERGAAETQWLVVSLFLLSLFPLQCPGQPPGMGGWMDGWMDGWMYIHVHVHVCVYVCMYVHVHVCMYLQCMYTVCTCMYVCLYGWMDGCVGVGISQEDTSQIKSFPWFKCVLFLGGFVNLGLCRCAL